MPNTLSNVFRNTFLSQVKKSLNDAEVVDQIGHQGLKGSVREIFVKQMMMPVLPPEVRSGSGKLVSHHGKMSAQIDVVLYAPTIMPSALFDSTTGLFPVEAALYTIEVKSRLTANNLKEAIANSRSTRALSPLDTEHWYVKEGPGNPLKVTTNTAYPVNVLFAFGTDLKIGGTDELCRYRKYDENADNDPALQVICVVGRGYWYSVKGGGWKHMPASEQLDEVMVFLAGTTNTLPQLLAAKGRPRFGSYLHPNGTSFKEA